MSSEPRSVPKDILHRPSFDSDKEYSEEAALTGGLRPGVQSKASRVLRRVIGYSPWLLLPISYFLGYGHGSRSAFPRLPTDNILGNAYEQKLTSLWDGFEGYNPNNAKFKGQPRQELDDAWDALMQYSQLMISPDTAKDAGYTSVQWPDGSGYLTGFLTVHHHLHCLLTIRRLLFPEVYTGNWEIYKPDPPGVINGHVDHCIDNIRQAIMCHGDTSIYSFDSQEGQRDPIPPPLHRCVNWDKLNEWTEHHSYHQPKLDPDDPRMAEYRTNYSAAVQVTP